VQDNLRSIGGAFWRGFWVEEAAGAAGATRAIRLQSKSALLWESLNTFKKTTQVKIKIENRSFK